MNSEEKPWRLRKMDRVYIPYKLSDKIIDRKQKWFYIGNHGNTIPVIAPGPLIQRPEWIKKPIDDSQILDLLRWIANLKENQLTGEAVIFYWMQQRFQPLEAEEIFSFQYQGTSDPSRIRIKRSRMERLFVEYNNYL